MRAHREGLAVHPDPALVVVRYGIPDDAELVDGEA
jgi:hypothetical protein